MSVCVGFEAPAWVAVMKREKSLLARCSDSNIPHKLTASRIHISQEYHSPLWKETYASAQIVGILSRDQIPRHHSRNHPVPLWVQTSTSETFSSLCGRDAFSGEGNAQC
jgi:ribosomal protein L39E